MTRHDTSGNQDDLLGQSRQGQSAVMGLGTENVYRFEAPWRWFRSACLTMHEPEHWRE